MEYICKHKQSARIDSAKFDIEKEIRQDMLKDLLSRVYDEHGYDVKVVIKWKEIKYSKDDTLLDKHEIFTDGYKDIIATVYVFA